MQRVDLDCLDSLTMAGFGHVEREVGWVKRHGKLSGMKDCFWIGKG